MITPLLIFLNTISSYIQFTQVDDTIQIQCSDKVSVSNSTFDLEGESISSPYFTLTKEGYSNFHYCLKDDEGNILEEETKPFFKDSQSPQISLSIQSKQVEEIHIWDTLDVSISIDDMSSIETTVYLDGKEIPFSPVITVTNQNSLLKIESIDEYGNQNSKEYPIIKEDMNIEASIQEEYTIEDSLHFKHDLDLESYYIEEYIDSNKENEYNVDSISLKKPGLYTYYLKHKDYSYLTQLITSFRFTNEKPTISILSDSVLSNKPINTSIQWVCPYFKEGGIVVNGQLIPLDTSLVLNAGNNSQINYHVEAYVKDLFGQIASISRDFSIDTTLPKLSLFLNDSKIESKSIQFVDFKNVAFPLNKAGSVQTKIIKNGKVVRSSLLDVLQNLKDGETITCHFFMIDEYQNQNIETYEFTKMARVFEIQEVPTMENMVMKNEWKVKDDHVVLEKSKKVIVDTTPPKCQLFVNGMKEKKYNFFDTIRISILDNKPYSNDRIQSIKINGKQIPLSKIQEDELTNSYYEFKSILPIYSIEVEAIDDSNNVTTFTETIQMKFPWIFIVFILPLYGFYKRHEKNTNSK